MVYRSRKKSRITRLVSVRVDSDIYDACRSLGLNFSYAVNFLLEKYLYIQKYSDSTPVIGSSGFNPKNIQFDFYDKFLDGCLDNF